MSKRTSKVLNRNKQRKHNDSPLLENSLDHDKKDSIVSQSLNRMSLEEISGPCIDYDTAFFSRMSLKQVADKNKDAAYIDMGES